jgi:hypothetical protein
MRYALLILFVLFVTFCQGLSCTPIGPEADELNYANYNTNPISFSGVSQGLQYLYLANESGWDQYALWGQGLPVTSTCQFDESTLLIALGCGTFSDGVYILDINNPGWLISEWFMFPNFVLRCQGNSKFYVGERDGLFQSVNCNSWSRVTAIGSGVCNSFANRDSCIVVNRDSFVYYSHDSGQTWQQADTGNLKGFRYTSGGVLHGIMDVGSDSDGLWRSNDDGATWNNVLFSTGLACIGPDFNNYIPLGWNTVNEMGGFLALVNSEYQLIPLNDANLYSPIKQMDIFPLVNTPSFFVLNSAGCFFLTGFLPVEAEDELSPAVSNASINTYPNPAKDLSYVKYTCEVPILPVLKIYNLRGQLVKTISHSAVKAKTGLFAWDLCKEDGTKAASGMYLMKLINQNGDSLGSTKLMVLK